MNSDKSNRRLSTAEVAGVLGVPLATASAAIALFASEDVISWVFAGVILALFLIVYAGVIMIDFRRSRQESLSDEDRYARRLIKRWPLPTVNGVDPFEDLRVASSSIAGEYSEKDSIPPYVARSVDDELDEAILNHDFVILTGPSKAGKSRTAYEACKRIAGDDRIVIPTRTASVHGLIDVCLERVSSSDSLVFWLDDLEQFIEAGELTTSLIDDLNNRDGRTRIVATMRIREFDRLLSNTSEIGKNVRDVMQRGKRVRMSGVLDTDERQRADGLYPGLELSDGIGERFVAADELVEKLKNGVSTNPSGTSLILAALDCRRSGISHGISRPDIIRLSRPYFTILRPTQSWNEDVEEEGFKWACTPIESSSALLSAIEISEQRYYLVPDFVLEWYEANAAQLHPSLESIPAHVWDYTIEKVDIRSVNSVAYFAYVRDYFDASERILLKGASSDDRIARAGALFNLGLLYEAEDRIDDSIKAYQSSIAEDEPEQSSASAFNLALLLEKHNRNEEAIMALRHALRLGHADTVPKAAINLGVLLDNHGRTDEAIRAYRVVLENPDSELYPHALVNLGLLYQNNDEPEMAEESWRQVMELGNSEQRSRAAFNLGILAQRAGNSQDAISFYEVAIQGAHSADRLHALINLGAIYFGMPNSEDAAERCWNEALKSDEPESRAAAAGYLGTLSESKGDLEEAKSMYQTAMEAHHAENSPRAALQLGRLQKHLGEIEQAAESLRYATRSNEPSIKAEALYILGWILTRLNQPEEAIQAYQSAVNSDQKEIVPSAAINLGELLKEKGDIEGAIEIWKLAIERGDAGVKARGFVGLGLLLAEQGDLKAARDYARQAVHTNDPKMSPIAEHLLQETQEAEDDPCEGNEDASVSSELT